MFEKEVWSLLDPKEDPRVDKSPKKVSQQGQKISQRGQWSEKGLGRVAFGSEKGSQERQDKRVAFGLERGFQRRHAATKVQKGVPRGSLLIPNKGLNGDTGPKKGPKRVTFRSEKRPRVPKRDPRESFLVRKKGSQFAAERLAG
jgi:hypothetical protein